MAGMPLHFPAFSHLIYDKGGYLLPKPWVFDLQFVRVAAAITTPAAYVG